ncbi:MAG: hypothetical protein EB127_09625 [Alphaproteobacteria bacterium]|nr:hypothetical protein [Alphaproteobacteria bacterium]
MIFPSRSDSTLFLFKRINIALFFYPDIIPPVEQICSASSDNYTESYRLKLFKNEKIDIRKLIDDLEGLFNLLSFRDELWEEHFLSTWGVLEDEYSIALDKKQTKFDDNSWKEVVQAVLELDKMIQEKLNTLPNEEDEER